MVSFKVCNDAKYQKITYNPVVEIIWYLPGFQLSHYTEGFCSASPLEEILAYTFLSQPIKSTTARFYQKKEVCFYFIFYLLYFGIWCPAWSWWIDMKTLFQWQRKRHLTRCLFVAMKLSPFPLELKSLATNFTVDCKIIPNSYYALFF